MRANSGDLSGAVEVYIQAIRAGTADTLHAAMFHLALLRGQFDVAWVTLQGMMKAGVLVDASYHNQMIGITGMWGQIDWAIISYKDAIARGLADAGTYSLMIIAATAINQFNLTSEVYASAMKAGMDGCLVWRAGHAVIEKLSKLIAKNKPSEDKSCRGDRTLPGKTGRLFSAAERAPSPPPSLEFQFSLEKIERAMSL